MSFLTAPGSYEVTHEHTNDGRHVGVTHESSGDTRVPGKPAENKTDESTENHAEHRRREQVCHSITPSCLCYLTNRDWSQEFPMGTLRLPASHKTRNKASGGLTLFTHMSDVYLWETYDRLGREALDRRDLPEALQAFQSAVAIAEEIRAHDRLVLSLRNLAAIMVELGKLSESHELLTRTLEVALEALGKEHSQTVETKRDLSQACRELGHLEKAEAYLRDVLEHELEHAREQIPDTLILLAQMAGARDDFQQAADYYERVVKLRTKQLGENHPDVPQAHLWLSTSLYQAGRSVEAAVSMERAFRLLESQFEGEPAHFAQSLLAGSQLMVESGQLEQALQHQKRALDLMTANLAPEAAELWEARELIAGTLAGLGKVEEAIELFEFCLRHREEPDSPHTGALVKNLAGLYLTLGQTEKAETLYAQATELLEKTLGKEHPAYLATLEERIQLYHFANRPQEALKLALHTIAPTEKRYGPGHPNTAQIYASTALLAHRAEEWDTALELMRAAESIWTSLHPQPEDVLANCRTNIATCLLKLQRFEEAGATLALAEETAGPSLRPVIEQLRQELSSSQVETEAPVMENEPEQDDEFALPEIEGIDDSQQTCAIDDDEYALPDVALPPDSDESADDDFDTNYSLFDEEEEPEPAYERDEPTELEFPDDQEQEVSFDEQPEEPQNDYPTEKPERPSPPRTEHSVERRSAPRNPLSLNRFFEIKVSAPSDTTTEGVKSFLVDLAPGGIRINSEAPFPPEGELTLTLPEELLGEETALKAEVVWQKPLYGESFLQGLAFRGLTSAQEELLGAKLDLSNGNSRANSRQHFRLYRPFPIRLLADGQEDWLTSYATDLSLEGLGTRLKLPLEQGDGVKVRLELEFELPTVEVEAKVAWSKSGENGVSHGLQFAAIGPVEAKTIKRYIDRCLEFSPD